MKRKLGELLIEAGAATSEDVEIALADQSAGEPSRLGDLLLSTGRITPTALARALADQTGLPFADLSYVAPEASCLIPLEFQRAHRLVPFRLDRDEGATRVHVALADPTLTDVVDELRAQLKREVVVYVAPIDDIESVHAALAGEAADGPVVMGEALEGEIFVPPDPDVTTELAFPPPLTAHEDAATVPEPVAAEGAGPASVTEEELFGSLDLGGPSDVAPLSTDLADEIGRHDLSPSTPDSSVFSALSAPLGHSVAANLLAAPQAALDLEPLLDSEVVVSAEPEPPPLAVAPPRIPSFAIPPEVPIEPRSSPFEPLRRPATLGRISLKRVAVNRAGMEVDVPSKPTLPNVIIVPPLPDPVLADVQPSELQLPDWMSSPIDSISPQTLSEPEPFSEKLSALLARVESGDLPTGLALASMLRLLVERRVIDADRVADVLEKL